MGLTTINSMLCSLGFNEHDKDIKYTRNLFSCFGPEHEKEKTKLIPGGSFSVSLVLQVWKRDKYVPEDTLLDFEENKVFIFRK